MRLGLPLAMLHGRMKQMARMKTFQAFNQAKHTVLFAIDVAAAASATFRMWTGSPRRTVPRTSPATSTVSDELYDTAQGRGLLLLCPSEAKSAEELAGLECYSRRVKLNQAKNWGLLGFDPGAASAGLGSVKYLAQRAVGVSYTHCEASTCSPTRMCSTSTRWTWRSTRRSMGLSNPPRLPISSRARGAPKRSAETHAEDDDVDGSSDEDKTSRENGGGSSWVRPRSGAKAGAGRIPNRSQEDEGDSRTRTTRRELRRLGLETRCASVRVSEAHGRRHVLGLSRWTARMRTTI